MQQECFVCHALVPEKQLQDHINACLDSTAATHAPPPPPQMAREASAMCPLCALMFPVGQLERHAARCGEPQLPSEEPTFSCGLCHKPAVPLSAVYILDECSHRYCRECIHTYATDRVLIEVGLKCPSCGSAFSVRDTKQLVPSLQVLRKRNPKKLGTSARKRLMSELAALQDTAKDGFVVELHNDNLFQWNAYFINFDKKTDPVANDLEKRFGSPDKRRIMLRLEFSEYPLQPPYVRVISPRFQYMTGHITLGGSVCFEMLTSQGWSPHFTIETLLIAIRANIIEGGARLDFENTTDYSEREAKEAFDRMLNAHGWST